jgi:hypothetical protein
VKPASPRRRALAALALQIAWTQPTDTRAAVPEPCFAEASFEIDHATVGQQVVYSVHIFQRVDVTEVDWTQTFAFPGFRAQWLSHRLLPDPIRRGGVRYDVREERRALFPERSGVLRVTPPKLRCRAGTGGEQHTRVVEVPLAVLKSAEPPRAGRPEAWEGLVGPLTLQTLVTQREIRLGESVRVAVMLRGNGNLWSAADPLGDVAGADVFRRRPELSFEIGEHLVLKRHFAYDVVPLTEGELMIPAVEVAFFDPATATFRSARTPATRVTVQPRATPAASRPSQPIARPPLPLAKSNDTMADWRGYGFVSVVVLAIGVLAAAAARRRRRTLRTLVAFDLSLAEPTEDEAAVCARALRQALTRHLPRAESLTAEEIATHSRLPRRAAAAARLLEQVENARFDPVAPLPSRDSVRRALAAL